MDKVCAAFSGLRFLDICSYRTRGTEELLPEHRTHAILLFF